MSSTSAKDLLAQADRLMRQRAPEELPVLTDLVIEEIEIPSLEFLPNAPSSAARPTWNAPAATPASPAVPPPARVAPPPAPVARAATPAMSRPAAPAPAPPAPSRAPAAPPVMAAEVLGVRPSMRPDVPMTSISAAPITASAVASVRDQFNTQLAAKLEELQHSVFSQVMQQLELYADGPLKVRLREAIEPALVEVARDVAAQVAEDTATQVRDVVSKSVEAEIARLRLQLAKRRT